MKKCSKCGIEKDETEFCKHRRRKDGLHPVCKECRAEYRKENAAKIKAYNAEYNKENAGKRNAYDAVYRKKNADKIKAYRKKNADKLKACGVEYRKKNADKLKAYRKGNADKRRAYNAEYYKKNADKLKAYRKVNAVKADARSKSRKRWKNKACLSASKPWMAAAEAFKRREKARLGLDLHLDHIIPRGRVKDGAHLGAELELLDGTVVRVCGLHVVWNLQLHYADANLRKGTRVHEYYLGLQTDITQDPAFREFALEYTGHEKFDFGADAKEDRAGAAPDQVDGAAAILPADLQPVGDGHGQDPAGGAVDQAAVRQHANPPLPGHRPAVRHPGNVGRPHGAVRRGHADDAAGRGGEAPAAGAGSSHIRGPGADQPGWAQERYP